MDTRSQPLQTNPSNAPYRYGFNGKESDFEVKNGGGTVQDYGMRIYDPRLGKFLSVDPLTKQYPELTPYQFASNRPIDGVDLDGLEYRKPGSHDGFGRLLSIATDNAVGGLTDEQIFIMLHRVDKPEVQKVYTIQAPYDPQQEHFNYNIRNYGPYVIPAYNVGKKVLKGKPVTWMDVGVDAIGIIPFLKVGKLAGPLLKMVGEGGELLLKGAGKMGTCVEFAGDFMTKMAPAFIKEGAIVTQLEVRTTSYGVMQGGKVVTSNGYHTIIEVTKDGKTFIYDNLNSAAKGVEKEEFIKTLIVIDPKTAMPAFGEAAYKLFGPK